MSVSETKWLDFVISNFNSRDNIIDEKASKTKCLPLGIELNFKNLTDKNWDFQIVSAFANENEETTLEILERFSDEWKIGEMASFASKGLDYLLSQQVLKVCHCESLIPMAFLKNEDIKSMAKTKEIRGSYLCIMESMAALTFLGFLAADNKKVAEVLASSIQELIPVEIANLELLETLTKKENVKQISEKVLMHWIPKFSNSAITLVRPLLNNI